MEILNKEEILRLRKGEKLGNAAVCLSAIVLVFFIVAFPLSSVYNLDALYLSSVIACPIVLVALCGVAAYCNIKCTGKIDKMIAEYVKAAFIENAKSLHPEKSSITFYINYSDKVMTLRANNFKDSVILDFSPIGKLSPMRKLTIFSAVETRLTVTYIKLFEKTKSIESINYYENDANKHKHSGKPVYIIKDGIPDKRAYRIFMKNQNI